MIREATGTEIDTGPSVSWGGILCGSIIVLGLQFLFTLLGSAIGLSAFNLETGASPGAAAGAGIYLFITMLVSFFIGGYTSMRFAGSRFRVNAALHGVMVWAIVAALTAFAFGTGVGALLKSGMNMAGQIPSSVDITIVHPNSPPTQGEHKPGMRPAPPVVDQQQQQILKEKARQAAGTARKAAAGGTWYLFVTFFCGLITAAAGGSFGGSYFHRKGRLRTTQSTI